MKNMCEQVPLYFYGELEEKQAANFRIHVVNCPACRKELAFLEQMQAALVPPAAPMEVVEKVLQQAKPLPWWRQFYKPVTALLVCGLCVWSFLGGPTAQNAEEDDIDLVAYISAEADTQYNQFLADFTAFEEDF